MNTLAPVCHTQCGEEDHDCKNSPFTDCRPDGLEHGRFGAGVRAFTPAGGLEHGFLQPGGAAMEKIGRNDRQVGRHE